MLQRLRTAELLWPTLAMLAGLAVLVGLGIWQLQRKSWKEALVRNIEARTRGEPHPMTTRSRLNSLPRHGDPPELSEKTGAMDLCAEKPRLEPAAPLQRRLWNRRRPVSEDFARAAVASRSDPSRANDARARCRAPA